MSEYTIFFSKIENYSSNMNTIAPYIETYISSIKNIIKNLSVSDVAQGSIKSNLKNSTEKLEENSKSIKSMADNFGRVVGLYKKTESSVLSSRILLQKDQKPQSGVVANSKETSAENRENSKGKETTNSAALWKKGAGISGTILGIKSAGEASVNFFGASWDKKFTSGIKYKDGTLDSASLISASGSVEGHLIQGKVKGNAGLLMGEAKGTVGKISGKGEVGATLYKDGKLAPQLSVSGEASVVGAEGEASVGLGSENNNIHTKASGKLGTAKIKGEAGVGKITYKSEDGQIRTGYGMKGEVGAEAYVAEGTVSGGLNIFGIKIDVGLTGKFGGAGAKAGGHVTTGGASGNLHIGAGLGVGLNVSVDWSKFKVGW